jgi:hypothetical protein
MMPRLMAEESLLASARVAIGSGTADKDDARRIRKAWDHAANGDRPTPAVKATPRDLMAMGIGVRTVKRARRG